MFAGATGPSCGQKVYAEGRGARPNRVLITSIGYFETFLYLVYLNLSINCLSASTNCIIFARSCSKLAGGLTFKTATAVIQSTASSAVRLSGSRFKAAAMSALSLRSSSVSVGQRQGGEIRSPRNRTLIRRGGRPGNHRLGSPSAGARRSRRRPPRTHPPSGRVAEAIAVRLPCASSYCSTTRSSPATALSSPLRYRSRARLWPNPVLLHCSAEPNFRAGCGRCSCGGSGRGAAIRAPRGRRCCARDRAGRIANGRA